MKRSLIQLLAVLVIAAGAYVAWQALGQTAAREEADLAASLAEEHKIGTLLAIAREWDEDGAIREGFRVIRPSRAEEHARIWTIEEEED